MKCLQVFGVFFSELSFKLGYFFSDISYIFFENPMKNARNGTKPTEKAMFFPQDCKNVSPHIVIVHTLSSNDYGR